MREIDGRAISASIAAEVTASVEQLKGSGVTPTLAVVVPTDDEGSAWYVRSIERTAKRLGIDCRVDNMPGTDAASLTKRLQELSADPQRARDHVPDAAARRHHARGRRPAHRL